MNKDACEAKEISNFCLHFKEHDNRLKITHILARLDSNSINSVFQSRFYSQTLSLGSPKSPPSGNRILVPSGVTDLDLPKESGFPTLVYPPSAQMSTEQKENFNIII